MAEAAVGDGELTGVHCFVAGGEEEQVADVGGPGDGGALASVGRGPGQLIVGHFFQHAQQRLAAIAKVGEDVSLRRIRGRVGTYLAAEPEELVPTSASLVRRARRSFGSMALESARPGSAVGDVGHETPAGRGGHGNSREAGGIGQDRGAPTGQRGDDELLG